MKRLLCSIIMCILLNGCAVKFVYNQLDWVIPWYIRDYISLNADQRNYLKERLNHHLIWHRQTQLPIYAQLLRDASDQFTDGLTRDEVDDLNVKLEALGRALSIRIAPDIAYLLLTASDVQLAEIYQKFDRDNVRYKKKYLEISEAKLREKRRRETQSYLERWLGGITRHQQDTLKIWSHEFHPISEELQVHKLLWQKRFQSLIAQRYATPGIKDKIVDMFAEPDKEWKPEYTEKLDYNKNRLAELFLRIDTQMTQRQRKKLKKKLISLARDLEELADSH